MLTLINSRFGTKPKHVLHFSSSHSYIFLLLKLESLALTHHSLAHDKRRAINCSGVRHSRHRVKEEGPRHINYSQNAIILRRKTKLPSSLPPHKSRLGDWWQLYKVLVSVLSRDFLITRTFNFRRVRDWCRSAHEPSNPFIETIDVIPKILVCASFL